ncbi:photosystem II assembly protein [Leptolyngbya sp. 'hensonii']|uniref:photosynthesis system II assembly factor Ycf48 n=1 Tax=Leptolyngbya sp. 'hensonii' TaxID=1922337 RepID=UPI00094FAA21|nr:photosynthesis system II assembly factor Ycf48 [Leptolyngbya sp. 'hensonii']OLP16287.1 photosystem II assembly protein [Leptolyngbya sp. 'hensonii']
MQAIRKSLAKIVAVLMVFWASTACANSYLPSTTYNPWKAISVPTEATLYDISFGSPQHGWLVGSDSTILETVDGGENWQPKVLQLGDQRYRFTSVSFRDKEGWVTGQPSILLHTTDEGKSWSRVPLSEKLPGSPSTILSLGQLSAQMTTDIGAIYKTMDGGKTWKALVQQAVGVIRNISRSTDGKYVAVSAKGNFYSIWEPGQETWVPHNRNSSRRVQNMGFTPDGRLWMLARGGQIQFSTSAGVEEWDKAVSPEAATSWGLLDMAYRTPEEVWVTGGSGNLLCSFDGGKTWQKDREVEDIPSNLYKVVFFNPNQGFIMGQQGTLLKYQAPASAA